MMINLSQNLQNYMLVGKCQTPYLANISRDYSLLILCTTRPSYRALLHAQLSLTRP